jgi:hypothetical protein
MVKFGIIESPVDAEHPQTSAYKSVEFVLRDVPINFSLPSFGNPLWEEKATETISSDFRAINFGPESGEDEPLFGSHLKEAMEKGT